MSNTDGPSGSADARPDTANSRPDTLETADTRAEEPRSATIAISHLSKTFGRRSVLRDISFSAQPGRVTGFVGPNGAGKSTTLRILLGLERADRGQATILGRPYRQLHAPAHTVGAMLDGSGAHPSRTARGHLAWIAAAGGIPRSRIAECLEETGLTGAARQRTREFSLGMGQRLGIASALIGDPDILILDEPVNGLDPEGIRWIRNLLRRRADAGGTVLLSSHLMGELAEIADDVVVISAGQIVAAGPLAEVTAGYRNLEEAFFTLTGGAQ
ncbi:MULTISPECIES: ATP-binding cassette domain-containing protein [unclassified Actinobaculum]|uniref:ABC transporter ATP-binding protein n=1 Tax=unclassified Actinobaculum TaxID=2609299 RepID=UPI000D526F91|nr:MULTISPECIES: ATP-binding cassette domain-containing protein [unclassified Actinobaculum]AWE43417.1 ABC transporter [Actinobaculum sp. 313]RTE50672.1 ATP-binding cassette domain-containing protein [Actinobaculum sp. 352]